MKKIFLTLMLLTQLMFAQETEDAMLWKITGRDLEKPSYLFPIIPYKTTQPLSVIQRQAIENCERICTDVDENDPVVVEEIAHWVINTDGPHMLDIATEEQLKPLSDYLKGIFNGGPTIYGMYKPYAMNLFMDERLGLPGVGNSPLKNILDHAAIHSKATIGFQNFMEFVQIYDTLPYAEQVFALVKRAGQNQELYLKEAETLINFYSKKKINAIANLYQHQLNTFKSSHYKELVVNYNDTYAQKLPKMMAEASLLIALPAEHLGGKQGMVRKLRELGYTLEAID